jgi:hypothetical protein
MKGDLFARLLYEMYLFEAFSYMPIQPSSFYLYLKRMHTSSVVVSFFSSFLSIYFVVSLMYTASPSLAQNRSSPPLTKSEAWRLYINLTLCHGWYFNGFPLSGDTILVIAGENVISTLDYHICFIHRKREGRHLNIISIMSLTDHIHFLCDYKTELKQNFSGFSRCTVFCIVELESQKSLYVDRRKRQPLYMERNGVKSFHFSPLTLGLVTTATNVALRIHITYSLLNRDSERGRIKR